MQTRKIGEIDEKSPLIFGENGEFNKNYLKTTQNMVKTALTNGFQKGIIKL